MFFCGVEHIPSPNQIQAPRSLARTKAKIWVLLSFHFTVENDYMGEQRNPFLGFGVVPVASAHQFMFSVRPFSQQGIIESVDNFAPVYDAI